MVAKPQSVLVITGSLPSGAAHPTPYLEWQGRGGGQPMRARLTRLMMAGGTCAPVAIRNRLGTGPCSISVGIDPA